MVLHHCGRVGRRRISERSYFIVRPFFLTLFYFAQSAMKISIVCLGKTDNLFLINEIDKYIKRINKYCKIGVEIIPDIKEKNISFDVQKKIEGKKLLEYLKNFNYVVLLDEKGTEYSSSEFSDYLQKKMNIGYKTIAFVIGGAYGFSSEIYSNFLDKISISKMTFSHQLIRLLFVEQLYRAFTILNNEPYHHS